MEVYFVCRCLIDLKPHYDFTAEMLQVLSNFAEMAVRHIEKDHYLQMQKLVRLLQLFPGLICRCCSDAGRFAAAAGQHA